MLAGIAVHEKAGAAEHLVRGIGRETHGERAMLDAVERRTDGVNSLGNGTEVADGLHRGIIFARARAGIAEGHKCGLGGREFAGGLFEEPHRFWSLKGWIPETAKTNGPALKIACC